MLRSHVVVLASTTRSRNGNQWGGIGGFCYDAEARGIGGFRILNSWRGTLRVPRQRRFQRTGGIAIALVAVMPLVIFFFVLFMVFGEPFGRVNDISIGVAAMLSGLLASRLYASHRPISPALAFVALLFAWAGAVFVWVGSYLVVSGTAGYFLAGHFTLFGYALIGLWLLILALSGHTAVAPTPTARRLPLVASLLMAIGFLVLPGIISQIDDPASASLLVNAGQLSWLGTFVLYPIWAVVLEREVRAAHQSPSTELG